MLIDGCRNDAKPHRADDATLVEAIGRKDADAFKALIERHGPWILGTAQVILGKRTEAERIVEEVFLELWDRPQIFRASTAPLRDNLRIVARGKALDQLRSLYDVKAASRRSAAAGRSSPRYVPAKPSRVFTEPKALPA